MTSKRTRRTLTDIVDLIGGGTPKTSIAEYWNGEIPWLSVKDFNNDSRYVYSTEKTITETGLANSSTKLLEMDDIIISARGTVGELAMIPFPMAFNQSCYGIRGKKGVVVQPYLYYLLKDSIRLLKSQTHGSVFDTITRDTFANIEVDLPPIEEQKIIADTLSALDARIAANREINHHLEQMAQAIFKSWFVDFEPFSGGEFIDSELGKVPAGWGVQTIEYLAEKVAMGPFGSNIKVETFVDSGVPIISGNHLRGLYLDELGYNFITEEHARCLSNSLVHAGDIIFTHAGNIGQVALIPDNCDYPYYVISQRQFYLRCDKTKVLPEYINYFFHSREGQGKLLANASQTGVPSIARPSSHLKGIAVVLPPIEVQLEWFKTVQPMLQTLNSNNKENKRLASIRDLLLPRLMSGELSVADL